MNRVRAWTVTTAVMSTVGLAGCVPPPPPAAPPPPPPPPLTVPQQRAADAEQFREALGRYDAQLSGLPGHTGTEHRALAAAALSALTDALRLAYGANPPPGFTSDVTVVSDAQQTIAIPSVPRGRMEAAENQALPAAVAALREVAARVLYDDTALPLAIDTASGTVNAALLSQGPLHDGDATDAFIAIDAVLHHVDDDLRERFTPAAPPLPMPMVMPTSMPTLPMAGPSSMPDSGPATMPTPAPATMP